MQSLKDLVSLAIAFTQAFAQREGLGFTAELTKLGKLVSFIGSQAHKNCFALKGQLNSTQWQRLG